ncbi:Diacylglycerol kinase family enzyme [Deinococcus hopiensis KR-140]|uniref:Diacylglycerol kinase family enzyme n=1 Tax=Deinococcus hopiensis KR-140 TaxID=695939 RepID=A0A1W1VL57_9DEIO|nr:Diacylglycerol kinase family enzyme [Deinococcus hopiensis KR-140]
MLPLAVVLNPGAGRGLAGRSWPRLEAELRRRGLDFELIHEEEGGTALQRVQALPDHATVLAVGGDGTVGALLPALVNTGRLLAVIPVGTGNDFAGMLGRKPGDFMGVLDHLGTPPRLVDALRATILAGEGAGTSRLLLNGLGMGFDARVAALTAQAPGRLSGFGRYAWAALKALRELRLTRVTAEVDGRVLYSGPSCLAAVMNGTRYGGGFQISPASDVGDGRLNALVSGPVSRPQLLALMARVLRGRHLGHPLVSHAAGQTVTLSWTRPTPLHLDGDVAGEVTAVRVEVVPGAVQSLR